MVIETELKWALTIEGHRTLQRRLPEALGAGEALRQENRFFDTPARALRQAGMNLRLRQENDRLVMTCKRRLPGNRPGLSQHEEWEEDVDLALLDQAPQRGAVPAGWLERLPLPPPVREALHQQAVEALGGFRNQRLEFAAGDELVCLDATDYLVRIDHELEVETGNVARSTEHWTRQLAEWSVPWIPQPMTKFARFLALVETGVGRC